EVVERAGLAARHHCVTTGENLRPGVEQAASVGDEKMAPEFGFDQMGLRRPRRRGADDPARLTVSCPTLCRLAGAANRVPRPGISGLFPSRGTARHTSRDVNPR